MNAVFVNAVKEVRVPKKVRRLLLKVIQALVERCRAAQKHYILSDRTFLVKAVRVLKAKAASEGRDACLLRDLEVLRFLTAFRVPPEVHSGMPELLRAMIAAEEESEEREDKDKDTDWAAPGDGAERDEGDGADANAGEDAAGEEVDGMEDGHSTAEAEAEAEDRKRQPLRSPSATSLSEAKEDEDSREKGLLGQGPMVAAPSSSSGDDDVAGGGLESQDGIEASMDRLDVDAVSVQNIELLLARLVGSIDSGNLELEEHSGGAPRRWRAWNPREQLELGEVDLLELDRWTQDPSPAAWPRARQRLRRSRGGLVAVLRDVSMSMTGVNATWSGRVTLALLDAARQRRMRFGYIEFNHKSRKYCHSDGTFFSSDYDAFADVAVRLSCKGWTNYEQPLADALQEFEALGPVAAGGAARHQRHVLLITDGVPTHGDPDAQRQVKRAQELGVVVHSVYLGWPQSFPQALEKISMATQGTRFAAFYQPEKRQPGAPGPRSRPPEQQEFGRHRGVGVGLDSGFICVTEL